MHEKMCYLGLHNEWVFSAIEENGPSALTGALNSALKLRPQKGLVGKII